MLPLQHNPLLAQATLKQRAPCFSSYIYRNKLPSGLANSYIGMAGMNINGSSLSNLQKTIHLSRFLQCADTQVTCSGAKEKHKFGFIIR
jgi:hypothetical protein